MECPTPLSLIIFPVDTLLERTDLPTPYQHQLSTVRRNAHQLLRLINQLLDIHKLEAQQMSLVNEVGDLPSFIGQIVDLFRPSAAIKNLALVYETELTSGSYLFDADKWEKILYNLLSNAIKFTLSGSVTVTLQPISPGAQLLVRDTGIGIAADILPHIFDRYYQGEAFRSESYQGTGIGLALMHELVLRLGGCIQVASQVGGPSPGTQFVLDIPIQPVSELTEGQTPTIPSLQVDLPSSIQLSAKTSQQADQPELPLVLLVDDDVELREFMMAELASVYRVRVAANGNEGWIMAKEDSPDLVVSDLIMPKWTAILYLSG